MNDSTDRLTPDHIESIEDYWNVVEVKTTSRLENHQQKIDEATFLYEKNIKSRTSNYQFSVIVVSPQGVTTTSYDSFDENELSLNCRIGQMLKESAVSEGWMYDLEDGGEAIRAIGQSLKLMNIQSTTDNELQISVDDVKKWQSIDKNYSQKFVHDHLFDKSESISGRYISSYNKGNAQVDSENIKRMMADSMAFSTIHDNHFNSCRKDMKAVVQMPFFVARIRTNTEQLSSISDLQCSIDPVDSLSRLWVNCSISSTKVRENYSLAEENLSSKYKRYRVRPDITKDDKVSLAVSGIEGKKHSESQVVQDLTAKARKGFLMSVETSDIDNFISKNHFSGDHELLSTEDDLMILFDKATQMSKTNHKYPRHTQNNLLFLEKIMKSDIGRASEILSTIVEELNLSRSQFCKSGEFILKQLNQFNIFLLIKTTTINGPCFFSVCVKKEDMIKNFNLPFKEMKLFGECYISEFVSLNKHSMTHLLFLKEKLLSLTAMWLHLHDTYITDCPLNQLPSEIIMHINSSMLFWMEGKEQTSKECQQIRYAYMECTKFNSIDFNPLKILTKWDNFSRSRLTVWMRHKVIECFSTMSASDILLSDIPTESTELNSSLDKIKGIKSWVTNRDVSKFEVALNLSYFGSLHNKEDSVEIHGMLKIFEKVVKEELKMRGKKEFKHNKVDCTDHEFNVYFVAHMSDCLRSNYKNKYGEVDSRMLSKALSKLSEKTLDDLSTMKKSATGDLSRDHHDPSSRENERITCLEASKLFLDKYKEHRPMKIIGQICEDITKEYGGITTNLFKKLQIGGVREIFVLEFRCRIVMLFIETVSRTICEDVDCEMLTKGDHKLKRSDEHFNKVRSMMNGVSNCDTVINSDDATTWAQRFTMPVFGCFLSRILPKELVEPIMLILNLVTNKRLELPSNLLKLYADKPEINSIDESMKELKHQFLGISSYSDLLDPGSRMLKNKSNMMQGIMHYTSSLIHSAYMLMLENFNVSYIRSVMYSHKIENYNYKVTSKVSSDDSSMIQSLIYPADEKNFKHYLCVLSELKSSVYHMFTAKQSYEKSTTCSMSGVEEFNSVWYYKNTVLSPIIKFISSAVKAHMNTRMTDRFDSFANLRKDLLENGGSVGLCSIIMLAQASAHYKSIGLNTNHNWPRMLEKLLSTPHPVVGFFLFENPLLCGMFGQNMAYYLACSDSEFKAIHLGLYETENLELDESGQPSFRTYLSFGESKKYFDLKRRMGVESKELMLDIMNDPQTLFLKPRDSVDMLFKLKLKADNPQLAESLQFSNDAKMHAASVYILQDNVMLVSQRNNDVSRIFTSLIKLPDMLIKSKKADYKWLFQYSRVYDLVIAQLSEHKASSISVRTNRRSVSSVISLSSLAIKVPIPLLDILKRKWFKADGIRGSAYSHNSAFSWYQSQDSFKWLRESYEETITDTNYPFKDTLSMYNFIMSNGYNKKTIRAYCPMEFMSSDIQSITSMIKYCQWKGRIMISPSNTSTIKTQESIRELTEKIWRLTKCPPTVDRVEIMKDIIMNSPTYLFNTDRKSSHFEMTRSHLSLCVIGHFFKTYKTMPNFDKILKMIESLNMGVVGAFARRQSYVDGKYLGTGIYKGKFDGQKLELRIKDDELVTVVAESPDSLLRSTHALREFIRERGWKMDSKNYIKSKPCLNLYKQTINWSNTTDHQSVAIDFKAIIWDLNMTNYDLNPEITEYGQIRLVYTDLDSTQKYTVLSFKIGKEDIGLNTIVDASFVQDEMAKLWLSNEVCPARKIIEKMECDFDFENWCAHMIRERFVGKCGKVITIRSLNEVNQSQSNIKLNVEFESLEDLDQFMMDDCDTQSSSEESVNFEFFSEVQRDDLKMTFELSPGYTCPFFDDLIDHYNSLDIIRFKRFLNSSSCKLVSLNNLLESSENSFMKIIS